ncbi:MAG: chromosome segregation ATPase [Candidatus Woesearchaeota archaeon]|jgi:chromosome segregation ATPase
MAHDYEFVKSKDFDKVERELEQLTTNPLLKKANSKEMTTSIDQLHGAIDNLMKMFSKVNEDLTLEEREERVIKSQLKPITDKLNKVVDQNEIIAKGLVIISEHVDNLVTDVTEIKKRISELETTVATTHTQQPEQTHSWTPNFSNSNQSVGTNPAGMHNAGTVPLTMPSAPTNAIPNLKPNGLDAATKAKHSLFSK